MKTKLLISAVALGLGMAGVAHATDTNTLAVSATVLNACGFEFPGATHNLAFGNLDPTSTADATATVNIKYWCTVGTAASILPDGGLHNSGGPRLSNGTNFIPYALTLTGNTGTGAGKMSMLTMTATGTIANSNYVNAPVGSYTDTVVLTLTP